MYECPDAVQIINTTRDIMAKIGCKNARNLGSGFFDISKINKIIPPRAVIINKTKDAIGPG